jgi:hypothetical protein
MRKHKTTAKVSVLFAIIDEDGDGDIATGKDW